MSQRTLKPTRARIAAVAAAPLLSLALLVPTAHAAPVAGAAYQSQAAAADGGLDLSGLLSGLLTPVFDLLNGLLGGGIPLG